MTRSRESLEERLRRPDALLSRTDLANLGLPRRAIDAVYAWLPVVELPGFSRPFVRVRDYVTLVEDSTYDGRTRVRPCGRRSVE